MAVVRFMFLLGLATGFFVVQDAWARGDRRLPGERLLENDPLAGPALRSLTIEEFGWRSIGGRKKSPARDQSAEPPPAAAAATAPVGPPAFMRNDHDWPHVVAILSAGKPAVALPSMARTLSPASPILAFGLPSFLEDADVFEAPALAPEPSPPPGAPSGEAAVRSPPPIRTEIPPRLADIATINLADTQMFVAPQTLLPELQRLGVVKPAKVVGAIVEKTDASPVIAAVSFLETGYVPLGDAEGFEPDAALARLRLRRNSFRPEEKLDWLAPPRLAPDTGRASYCYSIVSGDGAQSREICEAWALGRHGVVMISFAPDRTPAQTPQPAAVTAMQDAAARWLDAIVFEPGETYSDFDPRLDRVGVLLAEDLIESGQDARTIPAIRVRVLFAGIWRLLALAISMLAGVLIIGLAWLYARRRLRAAGSGNAAEPASTPPSILTRVSQRLSRLRGEAREEGPDAPIDAVSSILKKYLPTLFALAEKAGAVSQPPIGATTGPALPSRATDASSSTMSALEKHLPTLTGFVRKMRGEQAAAARARAEAAEDEAGAAAAVLSERIAALRKRATIAPLTVSPVDVSPGVGPGLAERFVAAGLLREAPRSGAEPVDAGDAAGSSPPAGDPPREAVLSRPGNVVEPEADIAEKVATGAPHVDAVGSPATKSDLPGTDPEAARQITPSAPSAGIDLIEPGDDAAARTIRQARREGMTPDFDQTPERPGSALIGPTRRRDPKDPGTII